MDFFDEKEWEEKIKNPLWYMDVSEFTKKLIAIRERDEIEYQKIENIIYDFFEKQLKLDNIFLGEMIKDFDAERKEIDTIVIHHTHSDKPLSKERLSAMELIRLYVPCFIGPTYAPDMTVKGKPIFSGHVREGRQVFYPYHWIIRKDGTAERLLFDKETGWHAGNWDVNCRSVAIAIDGNYENSIPPQIILDSVKNLIKKEYFQIKKSNILGHREINPKTTCPSNLFLSFGERKGWKEEITHF